MSTAEQSLTDQAEVAVYRALREIIRLTRLYGATADPVARALECFLVRVANTWMSIRTLRTFSEDPQLFVVDAGALLRAMIDAYLQAAYIVHDASSSELRAQLYLDFEHVERFKNMRKVLRTDGFLADRLRISERREEGEKRVEAAFQAVKHRYVRTNKNGSTQDRHQWHEPNLLGIAQLLRKESLYNYFVAHLHGCVHSSAMAVRFGPPVSSEFVLQHASRFACMTADLVVKHLGLELVGLTRKIIDVYCEPDDIETDSRAT